MHRPGRPRSQYQDELFSNHIGSFLLPILPGLCSSFADKKNKPNQSGSTEEGGPKKERPPESITLLSPAYDTTYHFIFLRGLWRISQPHFQKGIARRLGME